MNKINGIDIFREYFARQVYVPLIASEQSIMTHIIWLMNETRADEVSITLKQLSAKSNVDVRTIKAKLPQLCDKGYLDVVEISGDVCTCKAKLQQFCRKTQGAARVSEVQYNKYNEYNKYNAKVVNLDVGECESSKPTRTSDSECGRGGNVNDRVRFPVASKFRN